MMTGRVAVVGSNGLLGQHVTRTFAAETEAQLILADLQPAPFVPLPVRGAYYPLDITDRVATKKFLAQHAPSVVINCAAFNDVDACDVERERAWRINVRGVENIAEACRKIDARLVHFSSDYVFDGKHGPYTERDVPNPICYYGKTKLASENVCRTGGIRFTIVRTMILYGVGQQVRPNFVTWVTRNLEAGTPISVVTDQIGNPTLVDDLALSVVRVVERRREGLYHIAGPDIISRYHFAVAIANAFGLDSALITPILTSALKQKAPRPLSSGLLTLKAESELGFRCSGAADGLQRMRQQIERAVRPKA